MAFVSDNQCGIVRAGAGRDKSRWEDGMAITRAEQCVYQLDKALDATERHLRKLLTGFSPREIAEAFAQHVQTHLETELGNIKQHGNKFDE